MRSISALLFPCLAAALGFACVQTSPQVALDAGVIGDAAPEADLSPDASTTKDASVTDGSTQDAQSDAAPKKCHMLGQAGPKVTVQTGALPAPPGFGGSIVPSVYALLSRTVYGNVPLTGLDRPETVEVTDSKIDFIIGDAANAQTASVDYTTNEASLEFTVTCGTALGVAVGTKYSMGFSAGRVGFTTYATLPGGGVIESQYGSF
ncbi:MAG: hypothetical protein U0174_14870 [Polyangiaceae bacterium]